MDYFFRKGERVVVDVAGHASGRYRFPDGLAAGRVVEEVPAGARFPWAPRVRVKLDVVPWPLVFRKGLVSPEENITGLQDGSTSV